MTLDPLARPSVVHLPVGPWATVLSALCARFPAISAAQWQDRMARGRVLNGQLQPINSHTPYQAGLRVLYFREVAEEVPIPVQEQVLYADEHLVVADKPHFLPVQPSGEYVEETLLARLTRRLNNPHLVPLHRIDRLTAGLVLFSANPVTRGRYQALFRERSIQKRYEAIAPPLPQQVFPCWRRTRLVSGEPFFLMQEAAGAPNTETRIEVLAQGADYWHYAVYPITGKRHQLRVHMAALGAGILHDPLYPVLWTREAREATHYQNPLQLLAQGLSFPDPLTGLVRHFQSQQRLTGLQPHAV